MPNFNPKLQAELAAAEACNDALLRKTIVSLLTAQSDRHIDALIKRNQFPRPIKLGARCVRWRAGDVKAWLAKAGKTAAA